MFTIHDGSAGIFVRANPSSKEVEWQGDSKVIATLTPGAEIEMEGILEQGSFKPTILAISIRVLKQSRLPAPKAVSVERLLSGAEVTERVAATGVVQSCVPFSSDSWLMRINSHAGHFMARIRRRDMDARRLIDARVTVRGLVGTAVNGRSEFLLPSIQIDNSEDLIVLKPAPDDAFAVPKVALDDLDGFSITGRTLHRRRVEGTVTYCEPGEFLYIQQGTRAIKVELASKEELHLWDRIEVSGFLDISSSVAGLHGAVVRKLGTHEAISPLPTSLTEIRQAFEPVLQGRPSDPHDFDGLLVEFTGRLLSVQQFTKRGKVHLTLGNGEQLTTADLDVSSLDHFGELRVGSLIKVVGVAEVEYTASRQMQELSLPIGLNLLLRDASDITVLDASSWWTPQRISWTAITLGVVLIAVMGWSITLQRQLRRRTRRLEAVMLAHRDLELEFRGALHERQRLAADMHDGVQQLIAGAAFRLEAAVNHLTEIPPIVDAQLTAARSTLVRAQDGLRDCLTGMLYVDEGPTEFPALLQYAAAAMDHWPEDLVDVRVEGGRPYPLSRHVKGSLQLLMQEAVGNALKHGAARHVKITLGYHDEVFEMNLEDNGSGFDPLQVPGHETGHFGLESMRHRMSWLDGSVEILTAAGGGVRVRTRMPRSVAEESKPVEEPQPTNETSAP
ncbi:MAG: hypothetical protein H7A51_14520 [Akkermansiaceae bacterium]|nr:hypothetical protein [Akkermansiaceae bacterium]